MSQPFKINEELSIYVVTGEEDSLLHRDFFIDLYNNVFSDKENNKKAGISGEAEVGDIISKIKG
jgi:hypothetical protein